MPDFFTRLAERTLGLANTIQPVLPSLFAPGTPMIDVGGETEQDLTIERPSQPGQPHRTDSPESRSTDEHAEQQRTPAHQQHDRQRAPRSVVTQPDEPPVPTIERDQPRLDPAPDPGQESAAPPAERQAESAQPIVHRPAPATRSDSQRFEPTIRRAERPRLVHETEATSSVRSSEQRPTIERQTVFTEQASQALPTSKRDNPTSQGRATLLPLTDERRESHSQLRDSTSSAERPELVLREQNSQRAASTPRTLEPAAAQAGPQIQVSIGRIEVRAVTPPPAPVSRPTPASAPRMSLDDYLRSQKGGRR